jgi:ankyrin repeat protein
MKFMLRNLGICAALTLLAASAGAAADLRLAEAAKNDDKEAVRSLLKQHVDVNTPERDGATALSWASYRDDMETANILIAAGANVNVANDYGASPLMLACENGSAGMVSMLLKARANPNADVLSGETALMRCAHTGNVNAVKALLAAGANVNGKENRQGDTALMWALAEKHPDVAWELVEHGADIHARTKDGFTPLLFAAQQGDLESTKMLLDKGIDVNEATPDGDNALLVASASGHEAYCIFLLDHGANPNAADRNGITALHYSIMNGLGQAASGISMVRSHTPFLHRPNMVGLVKALLARGANPNARLTAPATEMDYGPGYGKILRTAQLNVGGGRISPVGATPLIMAALSFDVDLMRFLVASGADPKLATQDNVTTIMAMLGLGRERASLISYTQAQEPKVLEGVKMLVDLGVDVNAVETDTGLTALHCAAFYGGSERIIQYLVEKGANINAKTKAGQTALDIASNVAPKGKVERNLVPLAYWKNSVDLLLKLGATPISDTSAKPQAVSSAASAP